MMAFASHFCSERNNCFKERRVLSACSSIHPFSFAVHISIHMYRDVCIYMCIYIYEMCMYYTCGYIHIAEDIYQYTYSQIATYYNYIAIHYNVSETLSGMSRNETLHTNLQVEDCDDILQQHVHSLVFDFFPLHSPTVLLRSLLISVKSSPLSFSSLAQSDGAVLDSFLSLVHHV